MQIFLSLLRKENDNVDKSKRNIPIKVISQNRTELMALAIILVILCHSTVQLNGAFQWAFSAVRQFCQIGVDIFLFLSGLGIYSSLKKNNDALAFYKKRSVRLFVPYIIVLSIWGLAQIFHNTTGGIIGFVYSYSLITFFLRGDLSEWYMAAIVPLYLFSPLLVKYINKKQNGLHVLIFATFVLSLLFFFCANCFSETKYGKAFTIVNEIFIVRIPVFLAGISFGKMMCQEEQKCMSMQKTGFALLFGVTLFVLNNIVFPGNKLWFSQWYISRAIFGIICIPLLLYVGYAFDAANKNSKLMRAMRYLGTITLELYLLHVKVLAYLDSLLPKNAFISILSNILAVFISLVLAYLVNKAAKQCVQILSKRKWTLSGSKEI